MHGSTIAAHPTGEWLIIAAIIALVLAVILAIWQSYVATDGGMWPAWLAGVLVIIALILLIIWWFSHCHKSRTY